LSQQNTPASELQIKVYSRKIKGLDESPADILFRTHQYEFRVEPNYKFFDWAGSRHGFVMDLKIFKKKDMVKSGCSFEEKYVEYSDNDTPLILCTYTEDAIEGLWKLYLRFVLINNA
jgi:hypothetical protein